MEQNDYLKLSKDGKTVLSCDKGYKGAVVIPEGVAEIGFGAFEDCSGVNTVDIPDSVTEIGDGAFFDCSSLKEILVDENNPNYCSKDGILYSKDMSRLIAVPSNKDSIEIPESVTMIGVGAFFCCTSLISIKITDGVTEIGLGAFSHCSSLTSIEIPEGATEIGEYAFSNCSSLTSIVIPEGVTEIGKEAFSHCSSLTSIAIPDSVTKIGWNVFGHCTTLISVKIPDSVTEIGLDAFYCCSSLKEILVDENNPNYCSRDGILYSKDMSTLIAVPGNKVSVETPNSVKTIMHGAFAGCTSITSIEIPNSVTEIGWGVFAGCTHLTEIHLKHKLPIDFSEAFNAFEDSVKPNATIYVPKGSGDAYRNSEFYKGFKNIIEE